MISGADNVNRSRSGVWVGWARRAGLCAGPLLVLVTASCALSTAATEQFPELGPAAGEEIKAVEFTGGGAYGADTLRSLTQTRASHCRLLLPICIPFTNIGLHRETLVPQGVAADANRLAAFYRTQGFFGTNVIPRVESAPKGGVLLTFAIHRGAAVVLDSLRVEGLEEVLNGDSLRQQLPLRVGGLFNLQKFAASADTVVSALKARGHAEAQVLRNYSVDTVRDRATVSLFALPGPQVRVDSIIVRGAKDLGRISALRQLGFRKGDLLLASRLVEAQRNLYGLQLVQFANVAIAPDSLQQAREDSATATVLVSIAEAPVHQIDAAVGFGTVQCVRTDASWVSRSFGGGARQLQVSGSLSKLGVAEGLGGSLCTAYRGDEFAKMLDYRLATDLTQPYFLSPRNHLTLSIFGERQSEPSVFQREARGGRLTLDHRLVARTILTGAVDVERGSTQASPALFCAAFQVCLPADIDRLSSPRFRNTFSVNATRDETDQTLNPTAGYRLRLGADWAAAWLGSDVRFVRAIVEGSAYHSLASGVVFAASLRLGNYFRTATLNPESSYLSPEERFYTGGANSVRGYDRNGLGPGVYVTTDTVKNRTGEAIPGVRFVPIGGTSLLVANGELRVPSPVLPGLLRLAGFVDVGSVGTGNLWDLHTEAIRFTPGIGLRVPTPVGPARLDVAYNAYAPTPGPVFFAETGNGGSGTLLRIRDSYIPPEGSFWSRLHVQVAIGQAF